MKTSIIIIQLIFSIIISYLGFSTSIPDEGITKNMGKISFDPKSVPKLTIPPGRDVKQYPSMVTPGGSATKPVKGNVYTGTAMKGIGTLHKSNAVPIFSNEEAIDQANMRR